MARSILKAMYETPKGLHKAGTLDAMTMREFDALSLPPVKTCTHKSGVCVTYTRPAKRCSRYTRMGHAYSALPRVGDGGRPQVLC
jgi:hypothetical protein